MTYLQADAAERKVPGVLSIASEANGLVYFTDPCDRRIAIAGERGVTILTRKQAVTLAGEILEVLSVYGGQENAS